MTVLYHCTIWSSELIIKYTRNPWRLGSSKTLELKERLDLWRLMLLSSREQTFRLFSIIIPTSLENSISIVNKKNRGKKHQEIRRIINPTWPKIILQDISHEVRCYRPNYKLQTKKITRSMKEEFVPDQPRTLGDKIWIRV